MDAPLTGHDRFASGEPRTIATSPSAVRVLPGVYHLHPLVAGELRQWPSAFERITGMGFRAICLAPPFAPGQSGDIFVHATFDRLHPRLGFTGAAAAGLAQVVKAADAHGLRVLLDLMPARIALDAPIRLEHPEWFTTPTAVLPDPRRPPSRLDVATPRLDSGGQGDGIGEWWARQAIHLLRCGIAGFRCGDLDRMPRSFWRNLINSARAAVPDAMFLAWTLDLSLDVVRGLSDIGFDMTCLSALTAMERPLRFLDEFAALQQVAPPLGVPEPSFGDRLVRHLSTDMDPVVAYRHAVELIAATTAGLFVPMGFEYATSRQYDPVRGEPADMDAALREAPVDLSSAITAAIRQREAEPVPRLLRPLTSADHSQGAWLRSPVTDVRQATRTDLLLFNADSVRSAPVGLTLPILPPAAGAPFSVEPAPDLMRPLRPGEVRVLRCRRRPDIAGLPEPRLDRDQAESSRIGIEAIEPSVPGGAFAAKTEVGRPVTVKADLIFDGHDLLAADLLWRAADQQSWTRQPMRLEVNDRWCATFVPDRIGLYEFAVEAWWDQWGSLVHDLQAKRAAGQNIDLEIQEARLLLKQVSEHNCGALGRRLGPEPSVADMVSETTMAAMRASAGRPFAARSKIHALRADRPAAAFASWYELFPRSVTQPPSSRVSTTHERNRRGPISTSA